MDYEIICLGGGGGGVGLDIGLGDKNKNAGRLGEGAMVSRSNLLRNDPAELKPLERLKRIVSQQFIIGGGVGGLGGWVRGALLVHFKI